MNFCFTDPAAAEQHAAMVWYAAISPALALRFDAEVRTALRQIGLFPEANPDRGKGIRFQQLSTFPYYLVYRFVEVTAIEVLAVAHHARKPGYWEAEE